LVRAGIYRVHKARREVGLFKFIIGFLYPLLFEQPQMLGNFVRRRQQIVGPARAAFSCRRDPLLGASPHKREEANALAQCGLATFVSFRRCPFINKVPYGFLIFFGDVAEQFGTRTLWVYKMQLGARHRLTRDERLSKPLSYEDTMAIKELSPSTDTVSVELFREMGEFGVPPVTARYKRQDMIDALFIGVTADHLRLINATLGEGRFFTDGEDLHRRDVAVIGNGVRERFFSHGDAIGKTILVDGHTVEIIGTLTKFKSFLGDDQNDKGILIPYFTYKEVYPEAKDNFICVLVQPEKMEQAKDEVTELLRRRRHVKPSDPDNFGIASAESVINQFPQVIEGTSAGHKECAGSDKGTFSATTVQFESFWQSSTDISLHTAPR